MPIPFQFPLNINYEQKLPIESDSTTRVSWWWWNEWVRFICGLIPEFLFRFFSGLTSISVCSVPAVFLSIIAIFLVLGTITTGSSPTRSRASFCSLFSWLGLRILLSKEFRCGHFGPLNTLWLSMFLCRLTVNPLKSWLASSFGMECALSHSSGNGLHSQGKITINWFSLFLREFDPWRHSFSPFPNQLDQWSIV